MASGVVDGRIDVEQVGKAVDALFRYVEGTKDQLRIRLLDEDQLVYLVVALKKVPDKARVNPFKIPLPHPLVELDGTQDLCLIINDLSRGLIRKQAKQRVVEEGLRVSKVLGFTKLKKNYAGHEARRKLCGSYDMFLVDSRIVNFMPKVLGKVFYKKRKAPIPIDLTKGQWKSQFERLCNSTFYYVSTGSCSVVKVGRVSQSRDEIMENVVAVIEGVIGIQKWEDILSLHLKTVDSLSLPIYQSAPTYPMKIDVNLNSKNVARVKLDEVEEKKEEETVKTPDPRVKLDEAEEDSEEETVKTPDPVVKKSKTKEATRKPVKATVKGKKTKEPKDDMKPKKAKEGSATKKKKTAVKTDTAGTPVALRTRRGLVSKKQASAS